jgi:signal transduction histidine kinase
MAQISEFIRSNIEPILTEWETFARGLEGGDAMDVAALRDHARDMLIVIAQDLDQPQSRQDQAEKGKGRSDSDETSPATAAQEHGAGRADSGFTVEEMVAEFRALRASVIHLWTRDQKQCGMDDLQDMTRFNEAIDQAIAESIARYARQISQSKDRFVAILGHDLRTPIGAIITSSQFMLDSAKLAEPNLTLMAGIVSSARRMNQMVADLLDFTRTRFGDTIPIERADMDITQLVHAVAAEITASYPRSQVEVETSGDLLGSWDAARLTQALTNIVGNAVHHGLSDSPITISARGEPSQVVISVHNVGPVIPAAEFTRIFEAMGQAPSENGADRRHLGLGLYIVDKIVKSHGGSVQVVSSQAEGTIFTIKLPRRG